MAIEEVTDEYRARRAAEGAEALAHLVAVLRRAARALHERGDDIDSQIVEAHVAQLLRGHEWPGDPVEPWIGPDEQPP